MDVAITATRHIRQTTDTPVIEDELRALESSTLYVGGCYGGDCVVAQAALRVGHKVHTILPTPIEQLCVHWKNFQRLIADNLAVRPHTTTWEYADPHGRSRPEPYRLRNEKLVKRGKDLLLAFANRQEQEPRSGVTMTINIARRAGVPVKVVILHPAREKVHASQT